MCLVVLNTFTLDWVYVFFVFTFVFEFVVVVVVIVVVLRFSIGSSSLSALSHSCLLVFHSQLCRENASAD